MTSPCCIPEPLIWTPTDDFVAKFFWADRTILDKALACGCVVANADLTQVAWSDDAAIRRPVSYTHLTLPTKRIV